MQATANPQSASPPLQLNSKLIIPFVESTRRVFQTMVKVESKVLRPHLKNTQIATHDVSGIIGFVGDIIGSVVVTLQRETAIKLVNAFVGSEIDPASPDFTDAIGELANMIAGSAKQDLGFNASISVPTVVMGHGHTIAQLSGVPCIVIPCTTPWGEFAVEVNIKPANH